MITRKMHFNHRSLSQVSFIFTQEKIKERLVERENLHKNILSLKRDTAAIEAQIQNGAGIPGSAQTFDSSDIDQQSYAKQKLNHIL